MPRVSIIVPIFNGIRYLPYFFQTLAEALPRDAELILVDDGSSEPVFDTVPADLPIATVQKLRNERNGGYSVAVNRGLACATGDILVQLNTDLILDSRCITAMVDLIERTPGIGIVGSKQLFPTTGLLRHIGMAFGNRRHRHIYSGLPADHPLSCKTRKMQIVSGSTVAMTRQLLEEIGPLDERYYNTRENLDHCLKASARGYPNYTCAESIVYHWVGQSGPARFSRVEEDNALFWAEWTSSRVVDLDRFVDEALDHVLNQRPELVDYEFDPLSLCRSSDESLLLSRIEDRWPGAAARTHQTRIFNSGSLTLWLPMELPYRAMINPSPYIYLVDRFSQLSENNLWFETRHRIVETELVMDTRASVLTSYELLKIYGNVAK